MKSNLLHFPLLMTGMRVCYKVLSVQLVQDMHVIPRCWDTNDFRREEGPAIPPSQVKTTLNQGKNNTVERQALPPLRSPTDEFAF